MLIESVSCYGSFFCVSATHCLSQGHYIKKLLKNSNMDQCNPKLVPADLSVRLTLDMLPQTNEEECKGKFIPYREAVGELMF